MLTAACQRNSIPQFKGQVARDSVPENVLITGSLIRGNDGPKLAYTHTFSIEMADDKIAPRFQRAQTSCLEDQSLNCNLLEATITVGDANAGVRPRANLSVRLPHESVARFKTELLAPLPGEGSGEPRLRRSSTTAEDLTFQIVDVNRRLNQSNDFRDRLTTLARRGDAKVDDLIKVADKISEVQSKIEELTVENRTLNTRVDTELLNIDLNPYAGLTNLSSPLGLAWRNSARELGRSAADAFTFVVVSLPWLPLIALGGVTLVWSWRLVRKTRRSASNAPSRASSQS
ncbi:MAG TPA: DUF4349 domain-containing protein [Micropepsaceae bacterium]|nr:DUF4349 domain-containing protein [Micropepsaceae bacterium]